MSRRCCAAVLALVCGLLLLSAAHAFAHSITLEDGTEFRFDPYCCNKQDCDEVPLSAITQRGDGWAVDYISRKTGRHIRGFFKEGAVGQKWSPNHQVFACETLLKNNDNTYAPRCVYAQRPGL